MASHLHPALPIEILEMIIEALPTGSIPPVLRVDRLFHTLGARVLYSEIEELPPAQCISCLKTLSSNIKYAGYVRRLCIDWSAHRVLGNLLRLLHRALQQLKSLQHLAFELSPNDNQFGLAWVFSGIKFSLHTLSTSARCDAPLARFLETQPLIHELALRGFQTTSPFILSPDSLSRLTAFRAIHIGTGVLTQVVKGRPVESVSLSLFPDDEFLPFNAIQLSASPIKRLTVMSLDEKYLPCEIFHEVALRFPHVQSLHVVSFIAHYRQQTLLDAVPSLVGFKDLRYLTCMSGLGACLEDECEIATKWHQSCPSLKTIILPKGQVWFERDGKWSCCM